MSSWQPLQDRVPQRADDPMELCHTEEHGDCTESLGQRSTRRKWVSKATELEEMFMDCGGTTECGGAGQQVEVTTNYFDLSTVPKFVVHEYHVEFVPECFRRRSRTTMLNGLRAKLGKHAYDGAKMFCQVQLCAEGESIREAVSLRGKEFEIIIKHVNVVSPNTLPFMQLLAVLFRDKLFQMKFRTINRNLFELDDAHKIVEDEIFIFPGVKTSIMPRDKGKLMLCLDKMHKVMAASTLDNYMYSFSSWGPREQNECRRFLINQSVLTRYNMRSYRISDVDFDQTINSTFDLKGTTTSYKEYYKSHYNEDLRCEDLPLLAVRGKNPDGTRSNVYLVPELCHLTGVNTGNSNNVNIMRSLSKHCGPVPRLSYIRDVLSRVTALAQQDKQQGIDWGLEISPKPAVINARVLYGPQPMLSEKQSCSWNQLGQRTMMKPVLLKDWIVLHSRGVDAHGLVEGVGGMMAKLGMQPQRPQIMQIDGDGVRSARDVLVQLGLERLQTVQCVMFVQQDRSLDKNYKEMKKILCQEFPVISQFVKGRNCRTKPAIYQKIALQIGCKIGGEAWAMEIPFNEPTMIIGIDCYHSRGSSSVAAFVATMNRPFTKFYSRCAIQQEGQEVVSVLNDFIGSAFEQFAAANRKCLPKRVIIYRDGVGDGQLVTIKQQELRRMAMYIKEKSTNSKITFVIVKKRGSTRFFCRDRGATANGPAGLVVDHTITNPLWKDFYLIPQRVTQGTATPSHFNVLIDESEFSMDFLQDITYKFCNMYFNWTGPIRVPAVCQYAHKLAFLVGSCMSSEPESLDLQKKLYYL